MKRWIYKAKRWLVHKLGGYMSDEATPNRKIVRLKMTRRFTTDPVRESVYEVHVRERSKAIKEFVKSLEPYVNLDERRDYEAAEWVLRLHMQIVDEHLL